MYSNNWNKFRLLMWKNWLLEWRHKIQLLISFLVPIFFSALLVLIRTLVEPTPYETISYDPESINSLKSLWNYTDSSMTQPPLNNILAYSPNYSYLDNIMSDVGERLNISEIIPCKDSEALKFYLQKNNIIAGVDFNLPNVTSHQSDVIPTNLSFALRFPSEMRTAKLRFDLTWQTNLLFPIFRSDGPRNIHDNDGGVPPGYVREGFTAVQHAVSSAFIKQVVKTNGGDESFAVPDIILQRYPYPKFTFDPLLEGMKAFIALMVLLSLVYPASIIVKFITAEKEKQLKEYMKIMGLPNWLHWLAWFLKATVFMLITITIMTVLMKIRWLSGSDVAVLTRTSWSALWFFLFVYTTATTTFCFMLGMFFSKASTAAAVTGLVWFISYIPYSFFAQNLETLSLFSKLGMSLCLNSGMSLGFALIVRLEGYGEGLQWNNMWKPVSPDDNIPVGAVTLMMLLDAILHMLIALYVEKIMPGEFGIPEPWYFLFSKRFWCDEPEYSGVEDIPRTEVSQGANYEIDPTNKVAGIKIRNLRKCFSKNRVAVEGLDLDMYENEITALLGHNGAGKTTTMSMLTGMFPPTSGTAIVNGSDVRSNIKGVRMSMGLCPQNNILFDELTVEEHIIFYCSLKGLKKAETFAEIKKYTSLLELEAKLKVQASKLSGGMKRKLSVAIALCGYSKVVLCDEPTSGMDPAARRCLWNLLEQDKKGRTILLSTHFMDEADILGDRVAILSSGVLKACGSPFFLKKRFGVGYHLICVKEQDCDVDFVTNMLRKYIPNLSVESNIGTELTYSLPYEYVHVFEKLLAEFEEKSKDLKLYGYGISPSTLEEVFMRIENDKATADNTSNTGTESDVSDDLLSYNFGPDHSPLLKGYHLIVNQWLAMILKKLLYSVRNWVLLLIHIIIPVFFTAITVYFVRQWAQNKPLEPLKIDLDTYPQTYTVLQRSTSTGAWNGIEDQYAKMFENKPKHDFVAITQEFEKYILNLADGLLARINSMYMIACTITKDNIIGWFNNQAFHTAPLTLNMIHNAILKNKLNSSAYNIEVTNKPLPYSWEYRFRQLQIGTNMGFQLSMNLTFAMSFVSAYFVIFIIKERESRSKLLQFVSGIGVYTFWITAFLWDLLIYTLISAVLLISFSLIGENGWCGESLGRIFLLLLLFGFSAIPLTYCLSRFFKDTAIGYSRLSILSVFTGMACFVVVFVMNSDFFDLKATSKTLSWIFMVFPYFTLSQSLNNMYYVYSVKTFCENECKLYFDVCPKELLCKLPKLKQCCETEYFMWERPGVMYDVLYLIITGTIYLTVHFLCELRLFDELIYAVQKMLKRKSSNDSENPPAIDVADNDVVAEKERVKNMTPITIETQNLVINEISKYYGSFLAVNQISLAVKESECFGLLGVNGAGKTSTFKMLTGDEKISSGDVFVRGIELKKNINSVYRETGYCPQFDALIEDLTGRETLRIFCLLRGVPHKKILGISKRLSRSLGFEEHFDKRVKEYSGGNKRKLSTALALVGNPSVVYLDEPTTGMDPKSRRKLWNMICRIRDAGKSIILTSHSMEESEALCTRLAIMVNGEFKCLGSTQHLKNKFSKGIILIIKLKREDEPITITNSISFNHRPNSNISSISHVDLQRVKSFVVTSFDKATLKEEYQDNLTYFIPRTSIKWSTIFGLMEKHKNDLKIEDYSISQTTLEQIFLDFVKYQRDEK